MPTFTRDWTTEHHDNWRRWLAHHAGRRHARGLEVGCFEGRSTCWFFENILTDPHAFGVCIDREFPPSFFENTRSFADKLAWLQADSFQSLCRLQRGITRFDFAYVDACHLSVRTLQDCTLTFPLLKIGGTMIIDDYEWGISPAELERPKIGIDAFLAAHRGLFDVVEIDYQICLRKTHDVPSPAWRGG